MLVVEGAVVGGGFCDVTPAASYCEREYDDGGAVCGCGEEDTAGEDGVVRSGAGGDGGLGSWVGESIGSLAFPGVGEGEQRGVEGVYEGAVACSAGGMPTRSD